MANRSASRSGKGLLQRALVVLVAISLFLSFSHPCCVDGDVSEQPRVVAQLTCNAADDCAGGKTSNAPAAHQACHCLAHAGVPALQTVSSIDRSLATTVKIVAARVPETADPASPFKPPRA